MLTQRIASIAQPKYYALIGLLVAVSSCSTVPVLAPGGASQSYAVASFYGGRFTGKPTASGEIFDPTDYTAAHRQLPFGTLVRFTNPQNGRSVLVRINDRGPFIRGRHFDLSEAAARELGMIREGVKELKFEIVRYPDSDKK